MKSNKASDSITDSSTSCTGSLQISLYLQNIT